MPITNKFSPAGDPVWYTDAFRNVLEDHLTYLRNNKTTQLQQVEPNLVIKFQFDMFSLFRFYRLQDYLHWITMRMNGYLSPIDNFSEMTSFIVPDETTINQILQHYNSRNRKRGK